jgi:hypothetical protein
MRYIIFIILLAGCRTTYINSNTTALQNELHEIYRLDQLYRGEIMKAGPMSSKAMELWKKQNALDSFNLIRVTAILDSMGFPAFDDSAGVATFMVIQHAELGLQEKYLPLFQKAADQHKLQPSILAKMIDRVRVRKGQKQMYGTQFSPIKDPVTGYLTNKYELEPIEDEENVNKRRAKVGLPPIEEGAKAFGVDYKPKNKKEVAQ